jgi:hypothetical protein
VSEHTPGPWLLRPPSLTSAYIDTPKGGMSIQCNGIPHRSEWEANARLIAAAPELLVAAKEAYEMAAWHGQDCDGMVEYAEGAIFDETVGCTCYLGKLEAAIAKAETLS